MKIIRLFFLIGIALLISACELATGAQSTRAVDEATPKIVWTETPTPEPTKESTPTSTNTVKVAPSATSTSTIIPDTLTPTPSPYPTLVAQGPYLLFTKYYNGGPLMLVNAGGYGRKSIELPEGVYIYDFRKAVSPDGKWLAFYTGSFDAPYDLTLNLLSLPDGKVHLVTKLLSGGFPESLSLVEDYYLQLGYSNLITSDIYASVRVFDWSPDSRFLAFAGLMDGPSSDLYSYDVQTGEIHRMTDDLRILSEVSWSPDGKWLVFENSLPGVNYVGYTLHRIRANSGVVRDPPVLLESFWWSGVGWITSDLYMITGAPDGGDLYGLRYLDVETGKITDLWPSIYFAYAVDPENQLFAVSGATDRSSDGQYLGIGTYLVSFNGQKEKISDSIFWMLDFLGGTDARFIGNDGEQIVTISKDGNITKISDNFGGAGPDILVSPDKQWFVLYEQEYARFSMTLYAVNDQPVRTFQEIEISGVRWRADSSGLIATNGKELFMITIPDGELVKIDQCYPDDEECGFIDRYIVWLP